MCHLENNQKANPLYLFWERCNIKYKQTEKRVRLVFVHRQHKNHSGTLLTCTESQYYIIVLSNLHHCYESYTVIVIDDKTRYATLITILYYIYIRIYCLLCKMMGPYLLAVTKFNVGWSLLLTSKLVHTSNLPYCQSNWKWCTLNWYQIFFPLINPIMTLWRDSCFAFWDPLHSIMVLRTTKKFLIHKISHKILFFFLIWSFSLFLNMFFRILKKGEK